MQSRIAEGGHKPEQSVSVLSWLREPDHAEKFSISDMVDWINRRPVDDLGRIISALRECQRTLAMMVEPTAIQTTSSMQAWTAAVAAADRARMALTKWEAQS